jgi:hypothetical protein
MSKDQSYAQLQQLAVQSSNVQQVSLEKAVSGDCFFAFFLFSAVIMLTQ